ncbi:host range and adsorption protein [Citrobacter phage phiCFP-1]|uniref:Host specificity protein B n=1 Tax=Citrobacter phage phiCFP-1 TaxID=1610508 RepID=A0A0E3M334_9CAUD|nr:host range and adsorption protein [Citrobacter phage phiCFP-1]AKA62146.1 host specificity protein B [Citrobacter phage phiCFP-1]
MGFFKKIKKAVKKVVKEVSRPVEKAGKEVGKVVGGALGAGKQEIIQQEAPAPVVAAPPPAQIVDVPEQDTAEGEDEAQTESARKKARAGGKKALSVARSSGGGINI